MRGENVIGQCFLTFLGQLCKNARGPNYTLRNSYLGEVQISEDEAQAVRDGRIMDASAVTALDENGCPVQASSPSAEQFKSIIQDDKPTLVDFFSEWCPHCQETLPEIDKAARSNCGSANVVKVDVDKHEDLANEFGVTALPTLVVLKNGQELERSEGSKKLASINRMISKAKL